MQEAIILMQYAGAAYVMSIGFGMIVAQARGAKAAHRFWVKLLFGMVSFVLRMFGDLFYWLAKGMRR